jgi:hypothetical protein
VIEPTHGGSMTKSRAAKLRDIAEDMRVAAEAIEGADARSAAQIAASLWEGMARWEDLMAAERKRRNKRPLPPTGSC